MTTDRRGAPTDDLSRQGGWLGVVAAPLSLLALAMGADTADAKPGADLVEIAAGFASLCFVIGLVARHAHYRSTRWCAAGLVLGIAVVVLGLALYSTAVPGAVLMTGSVCAFAVRVLVAGIVPRAAMVLVAVAIGTGTAGLEVLGAVLGAASMAWLGYALWREPDPDDSRVAGRGGVPGRAFP